jgi:hypothetical protein
MANMRGLQNLKSQLGRRRVGSKVACVTLLRVQLLSLTLCTDTAKSSVVSRNVVHLH